MTIFHLIYLYQLVRSVYDSETNVKAVYPKHFDSKAFHHYLSLARVSSAKDDSLLLQNLNAAAVDSKKTLGLTNSGVLLFTKCPRDFIAESSLTAVRYRGVDKFSVLDRKDFVGNIIEQIDSGIEFALKHIEVEYEITGEGARIEHHRFPLVAVREALINALVHRDYTYQNSCVYLNIFSDRIEFENPGGIPGGKSANEIEGKSYRRNPLLADLLFRAGYGEKLGSGLSRMKQALFENGNPRYQIAASNFFSLRFLPRVSKVKNININFTERQVEILSLLNSSPRPLTSSELANHFRISTATITRNLKELLKMKLIEAIGVGKSIRYKAV